MKEANPTAAASFLPANRANTGEAPQVRSGFPPFHSRLDRLREIRREHSIFPKKERLLAHTGFQVFPVHAYPDSCRTQVEYIRNSLISAKAEIKGKEPCRANSFRKWEKAWKTRWME